MRCSIAVMFFFAALCARGEECITVKPNPLMFFNDSRAVFYARWQKTGGSFVVERVLFGAAEKNQVVVYTPRHCEVLDDGRTYLVSDICTDEKPCGLFVAANSEKRLEDYLRHAHKETHETVLAHFVGWADRSESTAHFQRWLSTASIKRRAWDEDRFTYDLLLDLNVLMERIDGHPRTHVSTPELEDAIRRARAFPEGPSLITPAEDRMNEDHAPPDVIEKLHREDLENELLLAIDAANKAAWQ